MQNEATRKERSLTFYCQLVSYPLETYATDEAVVEAQADLNIFKEEEYMFAVGYSESLCDNALRCGRVHDNAKHKDVLIAIIHHTACFLLRHQSSASKAVTVQNMARYANSIFKIQGGSNYCCIANYAEDGSRRKPSGNSNWGRRPAAVMPVAIMHRSKSSSPSAQAPWQALSRSKNLHNTSEVSIERQDYVAFITPQKQAPQHMPADILRDLATDASV